LLFGSIYQHFIFSFYLVLLLKNNAVQYSSLRWENSHDSRDCDKDVTSGKSWSSRRFLREFVG